MATSRICSIKDCGKPVVNVHGWCSAHYQRWHRHGDPLGGGAPRGISKTALKYLEGVVLKYKGDECLIWPFSRQPTGYGRLSIDGKLSSAHRVVCERTNGAAPTSKHHAAHSCGKGMSGCVTPSHLRWATPSENNADKVSHGTSSRGEKNYLAKLTKADVLEIRRLEGSTPRSAIAKQFGVSEGHIQGLHTKRYWAWL